MTRRNTTPRPFPRFPSCTPRRPAGGRRAAPNAICRKAWPHPRSPTPIFFQHRPVRQLAPVGRGAERQILSADRQEGLCGPRCHACRRQQPMPHLPYRGGNEAQEKAGTERPQKSLEEKTNLHGLPLRSGPSRGTLAAHRSDQVGAGRNYSADPRPRKFDSLPRHARFSLTGDFKTIVSERPRSTI